MSVARIFAWVIFSQLVGAATGQGDLRESFESAEPTWRFAEADCRASITDQQRTFHTAHAGSGSEFVQVTAENGTRVYLTHDIPPAAVIGELGVSLWIKADRPGVQLLARVVLPRSIDKQTGAPITLFVRGTLYEQVGAWQQLRIESVETLLTPAVRVKRSELRRDLDEKQAYIDKIVLNAYGGARVTNLYIDELEVAGLVTPAMLGNFASGHSVVSAARPTKSGIVVPANATRGEPVGISGTRLLVDGRPFLPRGIEHHGEDLGWLKSLGFNVIVVRAPPSRKMWDEARTLDLWLVAPPVTVGGRPETHPVTTDRLLAWNWTAPISAANANFVEWLHADRRGADTPPLRRPILWNADAPLPGTGDAANLVLLQRAATQDDLRNQTPGIPRWAQLDADGAATEAGRDLTRLRRAAIEAIAAGARGFLYSSATPLDGVAPVDHRRVSELQTINRELALLEPWLAGGPGPEYLTSTDPQWRIIALPTDRSRLLITWRDPMLTAWTKTSPRKPPLTLIDTGSTGSAEAYHITPTGLRPLRRQRVTGGLRMELETDENHAFVICTQDALAVNYLSRQPEPARPRY